MSKKEATQQQQTARSLFIQWKSQISESALLIYTDGYYHEESDNTACAFFAPQLEKEEAWSLAKGSSVFTAELLAIRKAVEHVNSMDNHAREI